VIAADMAQRLQQLFCSQQQPLEPATTTLLFPPFFAALFLGCSVHNAPCNFLVPASPTCSIFGPPVLVGCSDNSAPCVQVPWSLPSQRVAQSASQQQQFLQQPLYFVLYEDSFASMVLRASYCCSAE
jgi:hypothetical protein